MKLDENGNPIEEPDNSTKGPIETSGDFVDNLISGLLTDEEKTSLKPSQDPDDESAQATKEDKPAQEETKPAQEEKPVQKYLVDGKEVTLDELQSGYLRQSDYTRKTQAIADEKAKLARFEALNRHLENNPADFQRVIDALKPKPQEEKIPDDPIDAITYHATQEALKRTSGMVQGVDDKIARLAYVQQLERVKSAVQLDPLGDETKKAMADFVFTEYAGIHGKEEADKFMAKLDNEPETFVKYYTHYRKKVEAQKAPATTKPVSREKVTPFIADANQDNVPVDPKKKKRKELKALQEKTRGGKVEDLVRFLEASGMVDHLS